LYGVKNVLFKETPSVYKVVGSEAKRSPVGEESAPKRREPIIDVGIAFGIML
jgi:hypothetical protein